MFSGDLNDRLYMARFDDSEPTIEMGIRENLEPKMTRHSMASEMSQQQRDSIFKTSRSSSLLKTFRLFDVDHFHIVE